MPHFVIYSRKIEIHLSHKFWFEVGCLQLHHDKAPTSVMVEEQIDIKVLSSHFQVHAPGVLQKKNLLQVQVKIFEHDPIAVFPAPSHRVYLLVLRNQSNRGFLMFDDQI